MDNKEFHKKIDTFLKRHPATFECTFDTLNEVAEQLLIIETKAKQEVFDDLDRIVRLFFTESQLMNYDAIKKKHLSPINVKPCDKSQS